MIFFMVMEKIKYSDQRVKRDLTSILVCQLCNERFHPLKGKADYSRYCSPICARKSVNGRSFHRK